MIREAVSQSNSIQPIDKADPASMSSHLVVGVGAILLLVFMLTGYSLWQARESLHRQAADNAENLAKVLERYVFTSIHETDLALQVSAEEFRRIHTSAQTSETSFSQYLGMLHGRLPDILDLRGTNANGIVRYGNGVDPGQPVNLSDREHFKVAKVTPELVITAPVLSRISKQWVMPIARRLEKRQGEFDGVVYANISVEHFSKLFASLQAGQHGVIVLFDANLNLYIRYPELSGPGSTLGRKLGSTQFLSRWQQGLKSATYSAPSTNDGIQRMVSYRQVGDYPLYVLVGLAEQDYLVPWNRQASFAASGLIVLTLLVTILSRSLGRSVESQRRAYRRLTNSQSRLQISEDRFRTLFDEAPVG